MALYQFLYKESSTAVFCMKTKIAR